MNQENTTQKIQRTAHPHFPEDTALSEKIKTLLEQQGLADKATLAVLCWKKDESKGGIDEDSVRWRA